MRSGSESRLAAPAPTLADVRFVLSQYVGAANRLTILPLGSAGGFSGAHIWRINADRGFFCLKAWPPEGSDSRRLETIHDWMRAATEAHLHFIPRVQLTRTGKSWVACCGRVWELTTWLPGAADSWQESGERCLAAACVALARLHGVWENFKSGPSVPPGVSSRAERLLDCLRLFKSGWAIPAGEMQQHGSLRYWSDRAWHAIQLLAPGALAELSPWLARPLPLQPCLCDIWQDHVLFQGDTVTGIVDFAAAKMDHVAVDLARLLGSAAQDDRRLWGIALTAYREVRTFSAEDEELAHLLDRTGTIVAAANWVGWLYMDNRTYDNAAAVCSRLAKLTMRLENWSVARPPAPYSDG